MITLNELKALHEKGLALIYLHPRDKRPLENGWTTGPRKSWAELKRDFDPSYNVGVRLGEPSHLENGYLCCIDVDIKDPAYKKEALEALKKITKGKEYVEVRSGSGNGSRHLYGVSVHPFKMVEIEKHKGKWEICVYSTGRQMVLPPSIHPCGEPYKWRRDIQHHGLPIFKPDAFKRTDKRREETNETLASFKAVDVNLSRLDKTTIKKITQGSGVEDRSSELLSIAMKMCRAQYTDNEILSTLSDDRNWISSAAFDHTQSKDRGRAVKWLQKYTLEKARYETNVLRMFERNKDYSKIKQTDSEKKQVKKEVKAEQDEMLPDVDGKGKPKSSLRNVVHILEHFMGGGLVGFNEFSCRPYFLKDTPYSGMKGKELVDQDDLNLMFHIASHYRFEPSQDLCFKAHTFLAHKHRWHPVRAYLESLDWDGTPRLDQWLRQAFDASGPTNYLAAVGRKVLCAAVARVYEPGCKFDYMLVLEGNQGEGKSMSLAMLASQSWFTDGLGDIHNKDVVDQMTGKWVIEIAELAAIKGRENEAIKSFLSRQVDRVRISYGRRSQDYPRQSIFVGSTNAKEYFSDETGNRRYWPVSVGSANRSWLRQNRDQLWAEAKYRYEFDEKLYLNEELEAVARKEQEKRFEVDEWESEMKKIVKSRKPGEKFQTLEIFQALTMSFGQPNQYDMKRIAKVFIRLGFSRTTSVLESGVRGKCWVNWNDHP